jgi:hypothetical protein
MSVTSLIMAIRAFLEEGWLLPTETELRSRFQHRQGCSQSNDLVTEVKRFPPGMLPVDTPVPIRIYLHSLACAECGAKQRFRTEP